VLESRTRTRDRVLGGPRTPPPTSASCGLTRDEVGGGDKRQRCSSETASEVPIDSDRSSKRARVARETAQETNAKARARVELVPQAKLRKRRLAWRTCFQGAAQYRLLHEVQAPARRRAEAEPGANCRAVARVQIGIFCSELGRRPPPRGIDAVLDIRRQPHCPPLALLRRDGRVCLQ